MKKRRQILDREPDAETMDRLVNVVSQFLEQPIPKPPPPGRAAEVQALLQQARRVNAQRDAIEQAQGFAAPHENGNWQYLQTAMDAIMAGMQCQDWPCVAEGYVMLEDIERQARPPDFREPSVIDRPRGT